MIRDKYNIIPVFLAALLHSAVLAALVFAYDFSRPAHPVIPLAISATLVTEPQPARTSKPPPVEKAPEPEPQIDLAAEQRREAEEQKRLQDLQAEQERIRREKAEEEKRKQQAETERKKRDEAERKKRDEAERERREQEAERKRQEDVERQRKENERLRIEAEAAAMQQRRDAELAAEQERLDAMNAGLQERYILAIHNHIYKFWNPPPSAKTGIECVVSVRQAPGGVVAGFTIDSCTGGDAVRRSVEAAIQAASPLPLPPDPSVFERNLRLILKTEQ